MTTFQLVISCLTLLAVLVDLVVDLRATLPRKRRQEQLEDARRAVAAAEQLYRGKDKGQDRARAATQQLLDLHPQLKPARARMLVETAVSEAKHAQAKTTEAAAEPKVDPAAKVT